MSLRLCRGCGNPTRATRCAACRKQDNRRHNEVTNARYSNTEYQTARRIALKRDDHRCRRCGRPDKLTAHHVRAIRDGGTHHPTNLITLCHACHKMVESGKGNV